MKRGQTKRARPRRITFFDDNFAAWVREQGVHSADSISELTGGALGEGQVEGAGRGTNRRTEISVVSRETSLARQKKKGGPGFSVGKSMGKLMDEAFDEYFEDVDRTNMLEELGWSRLVEALHDDDGDEEAVREDEKLVDSWVSEGDRLLGVSESAEGKNGRSKAVDRVVKDSRENRDEKSQNDRKKRRKGRRFAKTEDKEGEVLNSHRKSEKDVIIDKCSGETLGSTSKGARDSRGDSNKKGRTKREKQRRSAKAENKQSTDDTDSDFHLFKSKKDTGTIDKCSAENLQDLIWLEDLLAPHDLLEVDDRESSFDEICIGDECFVRRDKKQEDATFSWEQLFLVAVLTTISSIFVVSKWTRIKPQLFVGMFRKGVVHRRSKVGSKKSAQGISIAGSMENAKQHLYSGVGVAKFAMKRCVLFVSDRTLVLVLRPFCSSARVAFVSGRAEALRWCEIVTSISPKAYLICWLKASLQKGLQFVDTFDNTKATGIDASSASVPSNPSSSSSSPSIPSCTPPNSVSCSLRNYINQKSTHDEALTSSITPTLQQAGSQETTVKKSTPAPTPTNSTYSCPFCQAPHISKSSLQRHKKKCDKRPIENAAQGTVENRTTAVAREKAGDTMTMLETLETLASARSEKVQLRDEMHGCQRVQECQQDMHEQNAGVQVCQRAQDPPVHVELFQQSHDLTRGSDSCFGFESTERRDFIIGSPELVDSLKAWEAHTVAPSSDYYCDENSQDDVEDDWDCAFATADLPDVYATGGSADDTLGRSPALLTTQGGNVAINSYVYGAELGSPGKGGVIASRAKPVRHGNTVAELDAYRMGDESKMARNYYTDTMNGNDCMSSSNSRTAGNARVEEANYAKGQTSESRSLGFQGESESVKRSGKGNSGSNAFAGKKGAGCGRGLPNKGKGTYGNLGQALRAYAGG